MVKLKLYSIVKTTLSSKNSSREVIYGLHMWHTYTPIPRTQARALWFEDYNVHRRL